MANTFTSVVRQHWEKAPQAYLEKYSVAMELATMKVVPDGTVLNIPRVALNRTQSYTKYTDVTIADATTGSDTLTINTNAIASFKLDYLDSEDNYISMTPEIGQRAGTMLRQRLDGDFLNQILNANTVYDNGGLRANTGTITPIALTTGASQNISTVFGGAQASLLDIGVMDSRLALVVDSYTVNTLNTLGLEVGFDVADRAYQEKVFKGYRGRFLGMEVYAAGCLTASTVLDMATNPTANDYIYIKGVKFTFVSSIGTTAGNVLIGASADATRVNLETLINAPETTTANGVALDAFDLAKLEGVTAVDSPSWDTLTLTSKRGQMSCVSSMTNASNDFQAETLNCAIMEKGAIWVALRDNVKVIDRDEPKSFVTNYFWLTRYGITTPYAGKERMVRIAIQSRSAEA